MELFSCLFLLFSLLLSATVYADGSGGGCFLPSGKPVDLAARCWDAGGGQTGLCCQAGDKCLNNTLCAGEFGGEPFYYRGYCTDSSWKSPGCPNFCVGSDQKDRIPAVYRCNGDDKKKQGGWHCGEDGEPQGDGCEAGYFRLDDNMEPYGIAGTKPELAPVTGSAEKTSTGAGDSARDRDAPTATSAPSTPQTSALPPSGASAMKPSDVRVSLDPPGTTTATASETHITLAQPITPIDPPSGTRPAPDPPAASTAKPSDTRPPPAPAASSTTKPGSIQPSLGQPVPTSTKPSSVQPSLGPPPSTTTPSPAAPPAPTTTTSTSTTTPNPNSAGTDLPPPTPSTTPPPDDSDSDKPTNSAVPIAVGVAVGGSVFIAASALLFFYQRRRHRQAPVRAETPPPFEFDVINSQAPDWLGPAYGPKRGEARVGGYGYNNGVGGMGGGGNGMGNGVGNGSGMGNARGLSEVGGTARFELA